MLRATGVAVHGRAAVLAAVVSLILTLILTLAAPAAAHELFTDDDGSPHEYNIELLVANGLARGCAEQLFCPGEAVSRGQMATFLTAALGLPASGIDHFGDDDGTAHEGSINALVAAGIGSGFADGTYRPLTPVSRGQMASLLAEAFDLPTGTSDFSDAAGVHEEGIGAVASAGITQGFADGTFRPGAPVRRSQLATFLINTVQGASVTPPSGGTPPPPSDLPVDLLDGDLGPLSLEALSVSWQRTGTLYCVFGSTHMSVTAPTVHATGYTRWLPAFSYYSPDGTYHSTAYGEWEWSYGDQPTGIAAAPGPWRRFRDGGIGGLQVTGFIPGGYLRVIQIVYDYDTGGYSWDWAYTSRGTDFCST